MSGRWGMLTAVCLTLLSITAFAREEQQHRSPQRHLRGGRRLPVAAPTVPTSRLPVPPQLYDVAILDLMEPGHREQELGGAQFQTVVKFGEIKTLRYPNLVKGYLDQGFEVVMVMEFLDDEVKTNLDLIADGYYDDYLYRFIDEMLDDGNRAVTIRPLHEFNGDWYAWGTQAGGNNDIPTFIAAWQHIHRVFTSKRANVQFQLAYNCKSGLNDDTPFTAWWPGAQYVDMVVCSGYNRAGSPGYEAVEWQSFEEMFAPAYAQMAALNPTVPLGIGETSTVELAGYDKAQWIRDAFASMATAFPRLRQATWFLQNKDDGEWDLNSEEQIAAFSEGLLQYTPQGLAQTLFNYLPLTDANGDGIINGDDAPPPPLAIDANNNGVIDAAEVLSAAGAAPAIAVPTAQPTAAALP
eukprot:TRINITY_DN989_c0_g1_i5.p1 TRINITY_DN989_c0_g1~~TRINITY_DN989_c0_g1_i5.p1  ORF type:complete len:409 (-),score=130.23 TRINITY_DN989_c0_g1_i5:608-1834(-)